MPTQTIHPEAHIGLVDLRVKDLEETLDFYTQILGFEKLREKDGSVFLGVEPTHPLVVLNEDEMAESKPPRTTGLYHYAILLPSRPDLGASLVNLRDRNYPLQGVADHLVSEAIYLGDPEGNGIELYRDRPRDQWPRINGEIQISTDPLDVNGLLAETESVGQTWSGLPNETRIGHVHLHVSDLKEAERFYCEILGFELITTYGSSAIFVSAGGYHHHVGLNTWLGVGAPPAPEGGVGLRHFTIELPSKQAVRELRSRLENGDVEFESYENSLSLRDPFNNGIVVGTHEEDFV